MKKYDSPAKIFLSSYIPMRERRRQLIAEMRDRYDDATRLGISYDRDRVQTSSSGDRLEESVIHLIEVGDRLKQTSDAVLARMTDILNVIEMLSDERYKTVVTERYIKGVPWPRIEIDMNCSRTQMFVYHGRALQEINNILRDRTKPD